MPRLGKLFHTLKEELVGDNLAHTEASSASFLLASVAVEFDPTLTSMQSGMLSLSFLLTAAGVMFSGALKHRRTSSQPPQVAPRASAR